ncbi:hypothetical protein J2W92_004692 [Rhizobium leguminosarum]
MPIVLLLLAEKRIGMLRRNLRITATQASIWRSLSQVV